ncbi:AAA family ATPase [Longibaculum muris]|uniref:AAA family ATPase n=1 Tax=Longibaculum muris TaxID=1796628 RepID=UPI00189FC183|nr:AAA family ATPase [Longibaculum muris]
MKKIPVGIENFKEIIDDQYYYIDKTELINDVMNEKLVFYTRPRRFGKTLNMSMLYYFFSHKEKDNAYLFDGLNVSKDKETMLHQNQYPVIFMTLKDMKNSSMNLQKEQFLSLIQEEIDSYYVILESNKVSDLYKERLRKLLKGEGTENDLINSLKSLSLALKQYYQKNVILLIDEYDVPLQSAYINGYYDEMVDFLRNVFSSALKTNDALEKGVLTGCLRISKESIFTGLNNFNVYSIMDEQSSTRFGFTQQEVNELLNEYNFLEQKDEVKEWYDGYWFGSTEIYNPWSVLKYVLKAIQSKPEPESFWANTSSNELVVSYIKNADDVMYDEFEMLMQGQSLVKYLKLDLTYQEMDNQDNVYSFLLLTGYLKVINQIDMNTYELIIPNKEVYEIYNNSFMDYFKTYTNERKASFVKALLEENEEAADSILSDILMKTISYYDNNEAFYHGLLMGLLSDYIVESNKEIGEGRADIIIYPHTFNGKVIIIECKHSSRIEEIVSDSRKGAQQIKDRKYLQGVLSIGYKEAIGYGIAFHKKRCKITMIK